MSDAPVFYLWGSMELRMESPMELRLPSRNVLASNALAAI